MLPSTKKDLTGGETDDDNGNCRTSAATNSGGLLCVSAGSPSVLPKLQLAMREGRCLLIEEVGTSVDPALDPVLCHNIFLKVGISSATSQSTNIFQSPHKCLVYVVCFCCRWHPKHSYDKWKVHVELKNAPLLTFYCIECKNLFLHSIQVVCNTSAIYSCCLVARMSQGGRTMVSLGDAEVDYHTNFRLYLTTELSNPHFQPEMAIKVNLINFTVTKRGLEEQLLGKVGTILSK